MSWQAMHCLMMDIRTAWYEEGGERADDLFETRLQERHAYFGRQTPFHKDFDAAFYTQVSSRPLHDIEPYLREFCAAHPELQDKLGYGYLADILRAADALKSPAVGRALRLLDQLKSRAARQVAAEQAPAASVLGNPCLAPLTLELADEIATTVGLIKHGRYILGPKKKSALIGFHRALYARGLVTGTVAELNEFFGQRYGVEVRTVLYKQKLAAGDYMALTAAELTARRLMPS